MKFAGRVACGILLVFLTGCGRHPAGRDAGQAPDFKISEIINTGTPKKRSFTVKVSVPSHYSEDSIRATLATLSNTLNEPDSEITMLFYTLSANLQGPYDVARVVWRHNRIDQIEYKPFPGMPRKK